MREAIESKVNMDAIDIYGLSEVIGPGVAQECIETKDGLTIWEDHFYPEIIDPDTAACCPMAKRGSSCSPRLPRRPCRSSATARAI
jgi:phenylacetate-CoA ligase